MGKLRLTFKTDYGEVTVEGDSLQDFKHTLSEMDIPEVDIESIINTITERIRRHDVIVKIPVTVSSSKPELTGVIEYGSDGVPHITVSPDKLTAREVIGLLLYAKSPNTISMGELTELVVNNWKGVEMPYISSSLNQMRAYVIKEGARGSYSYKLSGSGRNWIENELLPKLRMKSGST